MKVWRGSHARESRRNVEEEEEFIHNVERKTIPNQKGPNTLRATPVSNQSEGGV